MPKFIKVDAYIGPEPKQGQQIDRKDIKQGVINVDNILYIFETNDGFAEIGVSGKTVMALITFTKYSDVIKMMGDSICSI